MHYNIQHVNSRAAIENKHQWNLEQKKTDKLEVPKVDKNKWAKTIKNIVLHSTVTLQKCKVVHILPGYSASQNLVREMITTVPIVNVKLNLRLSQE